MGCPTKEALPLEHRIVTPGLLRVCATGVCSSPIRTADDVGGEGSTEEGIPLNGRYFEET